MLLCLQGIAARLAGGEDAVFGDELDALAQQADSSSSRGGGSGAGPIVRLAARPGLGPEEALQQLQQCMQKAAASLDSVGCADGCCAA